MKLLVTGAAGFIGSNFIRYWQEAHPEDEAVILDKLTYAGNRANVEPLPAHYTFVEGDITDEQAVRQAMAGCDTVVHFAAESHVDRSITDPYVFTRTNVLGTHVLLEAARQLGVSRFHHVSTDEVYGAIPLNQHIKFNEQTPYDPSSAYSASKAGSDHMVRAYSRTYGLPITISNCTNNYGPYMYPEKFIPRSIIRLLNGENVRLYAPGNQVRDWLFVRDHCRAIDLILQRGKTGETYCVGGMTKEITNKEVAETIIKLMDLPEGRLEIITDRPGHDEKYALDWSKINTELGWQPEHDFESGLRETIDWYKNNEDWWREAAKETEEFYQKKGEAVV
jgi:dTDP-glucose 4,6-dehydratase